MAWHGAKIDREKERAKERKMKREQKSIGLARVEEGEEDRTVRWARKAEARDFTHVAAKGTG